MDRYFFLIIIAALTGFLIYKNFNRPPSDTVTVTIKGTDYNLEIASTPAQQTKGLSGRSQLCSNCGMIFTAPSDGSRTFWMKDTLIPLDMIFINSDGEVVTIHTAQPEPGVPLHQLKVYANDRPARYVIELNAGTAQTIGLKVGDTIKLPQL